jgi:hypothetical protein
MATGCIVTVEETGEGGGGAAPADGCNGVPVAGRCVDDKTIEGCFVSEDHGLASQVVTSTCGDNELCGMGINGAECQLQGDCYPGDSQCKDETTLQLCDNGAWVESSCGADSCLSQPGLGAQCLAGAPSTGLTLSGHLQFEYLSRNAQLTDFDPVPKVEDATDFFVTVFKCNNTDCTDATLLGMTLTGAGLQNGPAPGVWTMELSEPINDATFVYYWPMLFDNSGNPRMAMAKAESDDAMHQESHEYWVWGFETCAPGTGECGTTDLGIQTIDIASGSGAANIYRWMSYGIFRFEDLYPGVQPLTFAVFHASPTDFNCGNCFVPPIGGGSNVYYDGDLFDHFDTAVNISGSNDSPTMWAKSVINHEFGHWSMASYTKSPGEGGTHYVDAASRPGLSYSEGYATFTGQAMISNGPGDNEPIYFTKKYGTTFWVDISNNTWSEGNLELPDPNGPIDQFINENVVASMFWSFWASAQAVTPQGLGDAPVYSTFRSSRLINNDVHNRGYVTVDFVDYLDAMSCEGTASAAQIDAVASGVNFPWDGTPTCP